MKPDLLRDSTGRRLGSVLARATLLGIEDFQKRGGKKARQRTGKELAREFCRRWKVGHEAAIKSAYSVGRWHAQQVIPAMQEQKRQDEEQP